jgi:hypothetical protein
MPGERFSGGHEVGKSLMRFEALMRKALLGFLGLFSALTIGPPARGNEADRLLEIKPYLGKDLQKLGEGEISDLLARLTRLIPKRTYREAFDYRPWGLWEFKKEKRPALYLLLEGDNSRGHPGSTLIRLTVLDGSGETVSEERFDTGWRCYVRSAKLESPVKGEYPLVVLETAGPGHGGNVRKQIYTRINDRFDLVRVEDAGGRGTRNEYDVKHFRCGPAIPKQTAAEWESDLVTGDRLRVLRVLVWMGGVHGDLQTAEQPDHQAEDQQDILLVRDIRSRSKVTARLKELAEDKDPWVREGAKLALDPKDDRFGR